MRLLTSQCRSGAGRDTQTGVTYFMHLLTDLLIVLVKTGLQVPTWLRFLCLCDSALACCIITCLCITFHLEARSFNHRLPPLLFDFRSAFSTDQSFPLAATFAYSVYQFQSRRTKLYPEGPHFGGNPMVGALLTTLLNLALACSVSVSSVLSYVLCFRTRRVLTAGVCQPVLRSHDCQRFPHCTGAGRRIVSEVHTSCLTDACAVIPLELACSVSVGATYGG